VSKRNHPADALTVGDLLLLHQLAASAAPGYLASGSPSLLGSRLDALGDARRHALAAVGSEVMQQVDDLQRSISALERKPEMSEDDRDECAGLIELLSGVLSRPVGAPEPKPEVGGEPGKWAATVIPLRHDEHLAAGPAGTEPEAPAPVEA
jgi:hypothetical protein